MEYLLEKYEWIVDEKKYFGQPNTAYDFEVNSPKEANRRIQNLQTTKDKLSKSVNMRAMNMLGKAEEQVLWGEGRLFIIRYYALLSSKHFWILCVHK